MVEERCRIIPPFNNTALTPRFVCTDSSGTHLKQAPHHHPLPPHAGNLAKALASSNNPHRSLPPTHNPSSRSTTPIPPSSPSSSINHYISSTEVSPVPWEMLQDLDDPPPHVRERVCGTLMSIADTSVRNVAAAKTPFLLLASLVAVASLIAVTFSLQYKLNPKFIKVPSSPPPQTTTASGRSPQRQRDVSSPTLAVQQVRSFLSPASSTSDEERGQQIEQEKMDEEQVRAEKKSLRDIHARF